MHSSKRDYFKVGVGVLLFFTLLAGFVFFYGCQHDHDSWQSAALLVFVMCLQSFSFLVASSSNGSTSFMLKLICASFILVEFFVFIFYIFVAIVVGTSKSSNSIKAVLACLIGLILLVMVLTIIKVFFSDENNQEFEPITPLYVGLTSLLLILIALFGFILGGHKVDKSSQSWLQAYGIKRPTSRASLYVSGMNLFLGVVGITGAIYYRNKTKLHH